MSTSNGEILLTDNIMKNSELLSEEDHECLRRYAGLVYLHFKDLDRHAVQEFLERNRCEEKYAVTKVVAPYGYGDLKKRWGYRAEQSKALYLTMLRHDFFSPDSLLPYTYFPDLVQSPPSYESTPNSSENQSMMNNKQAAIANMAHHSLPKIITTRVATPGPSSSVITSASSIAAPTPFTIKHHSLPKMVASPVSAPIVAATSAQPPQHMTTAPVTASSDMATLSSTDDSELVALLQDPDAVPLPDNWDKIMQDITNLQNSFMMPATSTSGPFQNTSMEEVTMVFPVPEILTLDSLLGVGLPPLPESILSKVQTSLYMHQNEIYMPGETQNELITYIVNNLQDAFFNFFLSSLPHLIFQPLLTDRNLKNIRQAIFCIQSNLSEFGPGVIDTSFIDPGDWQTMACVKRLEDAQTQNKQISLSIIMILAEHAARLCKMCRQDYFDKNMIALQEGLVEIENHVYGVHKSDASNGHSGL